MSKPKDKSKTKYTYKLEIYFDSATDNVEYVEESLTKDEDILFYEKEGFDIFEYYDKDSLEFIEECYEVGEA
jgi:hypothetical protein